MAKKQIIFRLTAFSAAAGKYNPGAPLDGNEDNFYVDDDLNDDILGRFQTDVDVSMSECGCLMVVADGMGGMNAGEVASWLAIETVKDYFAPRKITPNIAESPVERRKYLEHVIKEADRRIKTNAKENPAYEGMGSTIILVWIVGDKMTISWCGDSRVYRYNPVNGLEPLSRDHSYVQELVNQGVLCYEDTFEHPQGNIVTRSLGDPNNVAKPETKQFDVYNEDIILLCSDGLSGVLRDRKTKDHNGIYYPGENIEDIIAAHTSSMTECRDALLVAAEKADWYDNVTVLLCQIESGAGKAPKREIPSQKESSDLSKTNFNKTLRTKILFGSGCVLVLVAILCGVFYYLGIRKGEKIANITNTDSIKSESVIVGKDIEMVDPKTESKTEDKKAPAYTEKKDPVKSAQGQTPANEITPTTNNVTPVNFGLSSSWKDSLIAKLDNYSQEVLKNVVSSVRGIVMSAGDDDQQKCTGLVVQIEKRVENLNMLWEYKGKLNETGQKRFQTLLDEISDPKKFQPDDWIREIHKLGEYLTDREFSSNNELSPVNEDASGNQGATDA